MLVAPTPPAPRAAPTLPPAALPSRWAPVPLVTAAQRAAGFAGGEGAQVPRSMAVSPDGSTLFLGIDVGGIYRSTDRGIHWTPANVGYSPRGCVGLAFDPNFPRRVLAVGGNSLAGGHHGIYLSGDSGASWRQVLPANISGLQEMREQIVFDARTKASDRTRVAYWSRLRTDAATWGPVENHPAIYRTDDGGETWREIPGSATYAGGVLRVQNGVLLTNTPTALVASADGGATWREIAPAETTGFDAAPDGTLAYCTKEAVFVRAPGAARFVRIGGPNGVGALHDVKMSPADPRRIVLWTERGNFDWPRYWSADGGRTWAEGKKDATGAFLPDNARQALFAWDPKDPARLYSMGGDWPTLSTDGGRTYRYSAQGENAILVGGAFHFNARDPDLLYFGSQDYNGASTTDGGRAWTYRNPAGNGWGGFTYGGYALNDRTFVVGNAAGWGDPRILRVSDDGGATWRDTGLKMAGYDTSLGDPKRPRVAFASNLRTEDGGKTWAAMPGCDGVFCASGGRLYGLKRAKDGADAVVSSDAGRAWSVLARVPGEANDVAATPDGAAVYVAAMDLYRIEGEKTTRLDPPKDQFGSLRIRSVALDPGDPSVVYTAAAANTHNAFNAAMRSRDGGKTWERLNLQSAPKAGELDGGREAIWVRVNPRTREPWFATSCYGIWKLAR